LQSRGFGIKQQTLKHVVFDELDTIPFVILGLVPGDPYRYVLENNDTVFWPWVLRNGSPGQARGWRVGWVWL